MYNKPTILILVGITGDLAKRKLLPALAGLKDKGLLPEQFRLVGVTRKQDSELFTMDLNNKADYVRLKGHLEEIEKEPAFAEAIARQGGQRLFYLSVAPNVSMPIIEHLGASGLADIADTKLLLEKPFGTDLENGRQLIANIETYFSDEQVYRVDHYLQKDSVRSLLKKSALAASEAAMVSKVEIFAREQIGIEGRGDFYEQTGALRDFVQSHLLEVVAMVVQPHDRLNFLKELYVPNPLAQNVQRAQYKGYREQVQHPHSTVETFVSVTIQSHDPMLAGLSIVLKTGKALDRKSTDISIFYKDGATKAISLDDAANAYEHVFEDAIKGNKEFFVSKEEVLENWRIIMPIQQAWQKDDSDLILYEPNSMM